MSLFENESKTTDSEMMEHINKVVNKTLEEITYQMHQPDPNYHTENATPYLQNKYMIKMNKIQTTRRKLEQISNVISYVNSPLKIRDAMTNSTMNKHLFGNVQESLNTIVLCMMKQKMTMSEHEYAITDYCIQLLRSAESKGTQKCHVRTVFDNTLYYEVCDSKGVRLYTPETLADATNMCNQLNEF